MTPAFIYIFVVFVSKNREKRSKKKKNRPLCRVLKPIHSAKWPSTGQHDSTLLSAKTLALGKVSNVCRVPGSSTRQSGHVAPPWAGTLPSAFADTRQSLKLCRVSAVRHSAKCRETLPSAAQGGATWLLCRVPRLSAKSLPSARNPTLGKDSLCRVQTGLCRV